MLASHVKDPGSNPPKAFDFAENVEVIEAIMRLSEIIWRSFRGDRGCD